MDEGNQQDHAGRYFEIALQGLHKNPEYAGEQSIRFLFDTIFSYRATQFDYLSEKRIEEIKGRIAVKFRKQFGPGKNPVAVLTTLVFDELKNPESYEPDEEPSASYSSDQQSVMEFLQGL